MPATINLNYDLRYNYQRLQQPLASTQPLIKYE